VIDADACPSCLHEESTLAKPVARAVEAILDTELSIEFDDAHGIEAYLDRLS
jgi:hypothetical protein